MSSRKSKSNVIWIKLSHGGTPVWVNTTLVRRFEPAMNDCCKLFYTRQDYAVVDQSLNEVMTALGHPAPKPEPPEVHETEFDKESDALEGEGKIG